MEKRIPIIAGNWKMHLNLASAKELIEEIKKTVMHTRDREVLVAPPFVYLISVREFIADSEIYLSAQNMHWDEKGAYTGEISASMLIEAGCTHVILGHSERRHLFGETDEFIDLKVKKAHQSGIKPILCIGEDLSQRENGETFEVIKSQLEGSLKSFIEQRTTPYDLIIAYEPVWAIGTGQTATPDQAQEVHCFIRQWIGDTFGRELSGKIRILYGGSVKPANISELMAQPDIDGVLVGGASLNAEQFIPIINYDKKEG